MATGSRSTASTLLFLFLTVHLVPFAGAQEIRLDRFPATTVNSPGGDLFSLPRPALSLAGFTSSNPSSGLGLREILALRYEAGDPLVTPVFDRIIALAAVEQLDPFTAPPDERWRLLDRNTTILQSRAFEALVTFVLSLNDYDDVAQAGLGLRPHHVAVAALRQALVAPAGGVLIRGDGIIFDYMRHARSIGNVARAIDLYLALENAYAQFPTESDPSLLLSPAEKGMVMLEMATALLTTDAILEFTAIDFFADEIDLPPDEKAALLALLRSLPVGGRTIEEVEVGNWSMKLRLAAGYGALSMQLPPNLPEAAAIQALYDKAVRSAGYAGESVSDRSRHWNFMTYGGKRFWAEGPYYFDFAIEQVIPFWHAARLNGMIPDAEDVFRSDWFTQPLRWLSDLVAPDGTIPPIDDGNRTAMRYAGMLRWSDAFGAADLGRHFAWIDDVLGGPGRRDETLLMELAIPRTNLGQEPAARIGSSDSELIPHETEQQLIARSVLAGGGTDYVLLNGEHGEAVDRGEGHEQPDQLQLLYYRDNVSYLLDSGYDRGFTVANSSWNHYFDHNVVTAGGGEGGLNPPFLDIFDVRKSSEPEALGEVDALQITQHGALFLLHGAQELNVGNDPTAHPHYTRDVLYVPGADPYLIDLNVIRNETPPVDCAANLFQLRYHVNAADATNEATEAGQMPLVRWTSIGGDADRALDVRPMTVEFELSAAESAYISLDPDAVLEQEGPSGKVAAEILRLTLSTGERCRPYWSIFSIIQPTQADADVVPEPARLWQYDAEMTVQGWVWRQGPDAFDVYVARSVGASPGETLVPVYRSRSDAPPLAMTLPANARFGFARIVRGSDGWQVDPARVLGLEVWEADAAVADLLASVNDVEVREQIRIPLRMKLGRILASLASGRDATAANQLSAFVSQVQAQSGKAIEESVAEAWINEANTIFEVLQGVAASQRLALGEVIGEREVPTSFALHGNYPNPFNPSTTINLQLPETAYVRVVVFDLLGREVARVVEGELGAGEHHVRWDAGPLPSGVYLCRMTAGAFTAVRPMLLMR